MAFLFLPQQLLMATIIGNKLIERSNTRTNTCIQTSFTKRMSIFLQVLHATLIQQITKDYRPIQLTNYLNQPTSACEGLLQQNVQ
jgi:hypothetical protein